MSHDGRRRGGLLWLGIVAILVLLLPSLAPAVAARSPLVGDRFEYDFHTTVDQGDRAYFGYSDRMRSHSVYAVEAVQGDQVTVRGTGSWTFDGSDGTHLSGSVDVTPVFSLTTRRYLSGVDVELTDPDLTVWFWIRTPVAVGDTVPILNDVFTVTSLGATVWRGLVPHRAILLEASGQYDRNDSYGLFTATYHDRYYFDPDSGFIVMEQYEERDVNDFASFRYRGEVLVTSSSYPIPLDLVTLSLVDIGIPAAAAGSVLGLIRVRRGPTRFSIGSKEFPKEVRIRKAKSTAEAVGLVPDGSPFFGPFLPVFAERSIAEGDPVVFALSDRTIVGMALLDRESGLGSVFATEPTVARVLLKRVRMRDFFADATIPGRIAGAREIDRFTILQCRNPSSLPYDPSVVRPMQADDIGAVVSIAASVYGGRARRFIESSFRGGDFGFVALSNGRIVGFGFATVVGTLGRLHTLTVAVAERSRGLGTELMNARLSALSALGVDRVIVEISKQNVASLRIANRAGFVPVGETVYYSRHPAAAPSVVQRQT